MALRSAENCDDEMVGAEDDDEVVEDVADAEVVALADELALDDELLLLPHPAANAATTRVSRDTRNQLKLITARSSHRRAKVNTIKRLMPVSPAESTLSNGAAVVHLH
jgi:hypothetical protein